MTKKGLQNDKAQTLWGKSKVRIWTFRGAEMTSADNIVICSESREQNIEICSYALERGWTKVSRDICDKRVTSNVTGHF